MQYGLEINFKQLGQQKSIFPNLDKQRKREDQIVSEDITTFCLFSTTMTKQKYNKSRSISEHQTRACVNLSTWGWLSPSA